jgi:hypothetical protein
MKRIIILSITTVVFLLAQSCSKDKRIERSLEKKDGKWNINKYAYEEYTNGTLSESETYLNAGNIVFSDNGILVWTFNIDGDIETYGGQWANDDESITLIIDGDAIKFDILERSKKEMKLSGVVDTYTIGSTTYEDKFQLEIERD